jgi:hypothetical protein
MVTKLSPPGKAFRPWLCFRWMTARIHSSDEIAAQPSIPDRWAGDRDAGGRRSPKTPVVIGGTPPPEHAVAPLPGARKKAVAQGLRDPRRSASSSAMPGTGAEAEAVVAGNEVGITGARKCAVPLCSARLCAGLICGNMKMTWWRGCVCIPGGQGVAGSNPAVPTGQRLISNAEARLRVASGSAQRSHCIGWARSSPESAYDP